VSNSGKSWVLSQEAFDKLLLALDPDREQAGHKYEMLRQKLVKFFEWRGAVTPEDHADEVFNRLARKIDRGEVLRDLSSYSLGVGRMMLLEMSRETKAATMVREQDVLELPNSRSLDPALQALACLEACLEKLPVQNRDLILEYYQREGGGPIERRQKLAARMGIPLNALRIRAHRIRTGLEECVTDCLLRGHERETRT
jgi:DNA-directed RNA polymerase specialized sigma24 family protein